MADSPLVSADSHIVEVSDVYTRYAASTEVEMPRLVPDGAGGECFFVPGMSGTVGLGLAAAAGEPAENVRDVGTRGGQIRPGASDLRKRTVDQDADGIAAEVLYPTVGLFLLEHVNRGYAQTVLSVYNRWLADAISGKQERYIGCGASSAPSSESAVSTIIACREMGLSGVVLPLHPGEGAYSATTYDRLWSAAVDSGTPLTFHALPSSNPAATGAAHGIGLSALWDAQNLLTDLVFGGVLERHPDLRVVFAEFDSGWVPYLLQRLDHYFLRHRRWLAMDTGVRRLPSEYVAESVYFTFQDDDLAVKHAAAARLNLLWGSDFPHAESTWPHSRGVVERLGRNLSEDDARSVFGDSVLDLYGVRP
ncbi:putative TIM-barrel fold metal-dependent hydrolase [Mycobacterium tuberculosis]|nr:putative TIM-barrel fold metal-dependent hydrolase [Mycobacterium tuberculosis]